MRKRRAIIHIGTPKTGTTSIQRMLAANRPALQERGVVFARSPGEKNHMRLAIYAVTPAGRGNKMAQVIGAAGDGGWVSGRLERDLAEEVAAVPDHVHTVVFSNEHLTHKVNTPETALRLKGLLDAHFDSYGIIAYLRRQDEYAVSLYSTRLRSGSARAHVLPEIVPGRRSYARFDYEALLERWVAAFGRVAVTPRVFARDAFVEGDLIADFLAAIGVEGWRPEPDRARSVNPALKPAAQDFLRRLNLAAKAAAGVTEVGGEDDEDEKVPTFIRQYLDHNHAGAGRRPSRAEAEAFVAHYRESNERVRAAFFPGRARLFSDDFGRYPEEADPLPPVEGVLDIALGLILRQAEEAPGQVAEAACQRAREAAAAGDVDAARRAFNRALAKEPAHLGALRGLADLGEDDADAAEEARARVARAWGMEPDSAEIRRLADQLGVAAPSASAARLPGAPKGAGGGGGKGAGKGGGGGAEAAERTAARRAERQAERQAERRAERKGGRAKERKTEPSAA